MFVEKDNREMFTGVLKVAGGFFPGKVILGEFLPGAGNFLRGYFRFSEKRFYRI